MDAQPFHEQFTGRRDTPVTSQVLEERINVYISAMDRAQSMNDTSMSSQLQRDIQQLVDLMEKVQSGQTVIEKDVPPPLVMTPINDVLVNPLDELSSRLSDYHKALYFAEEELSEGRMDKIQTLQKGLQMIHSLQKRAQAGFPIREDEVPPPVKIPSDSEFDNDAVKTITNRLEHYNKILKYLETSSDADRRRIPKIQSGIRALEFLWTRAKANRPVWLKDIPAEFEYCTLVLENPKKSRTSRLSSLVTRVKNVKCERPDQQSVADELLQKLEDLVKQSPSLTTSDMDIENLVHLVEALEKITGSASASNHQEVLTLIDLRIQEYYTVTLKDHNEGNTQNNLQNMIVIKRLQRMKEKLEKGGSVDISLVPPSPQNDDTPLTQSPPSLPQSSEPSQVTTAHAQVTEVNTKPVAVESDKSKLARKLTSYLDLDSEALSPNSTPSSSFDSDSVPSPQEVVVGHVPASQPHPEPIAEAVPSAKYPHHGNEAISQPALQKISLSSIGFVNCENNTSSGAVDASHSSSDQLSATSCFQETKISVNTDKKNSNASRALRGNFNYLSDTKGGDDESLTKSVSSLENKGRKISNELGVQQTADLSSKTTEQSSSNQGSSSSRHLDSIGFLSCQDVPSFSLASSLNQSLHPTNSTHSTHSTSSQVRSKSSENTSPIKLATSKITASTADIPDVKNYDQSEKHVDQSISQSVCNEESSISLGLDDSHTTPVLNHSEQLSSNRNQMDNSALISNDTTSGMDPQYNSNQSNNILTSQLNSATGTPTCEPSSHTDDFNLGTEISKENSSADFVTLRNENDDVNDNKSTDSTVGIIDKDADYSAPSNLLQEVNTLVEKKSICLSEETIGVMKSTAFSVTDLDEFEDLKNSMSAAPSLMTGKQSSSCSTVNDEHYSQKKDLSNGSHFHNGTLATKASLSFPHNQNNVASDCHEKSDPDSVEISKSAVDSFPGNFPISPSLQSASELRISAPTVTSLNDIAVVSSSLVSNVSNTPQLSQEIHRNQILSQPMTSMTPTSVPSLLNSSPTLLSSESFMKDGNSLMARTGRSVPVSSVNSNSSPFTCLETLKYDILIADAKNLEESKKEADKLRIEMEAIKHFLRNGRRKVWEEYKNRVEYELQVLNNGVKQCEETQNWDQYKYLNSKRMVNEKELALLNQRICEIQE